MKGTLSSVRRNCYIHETCPDNEGAIGDYKPNTNVPQIIGLMLREAGYQVHKFNSGFP